MLKNCLYLIIAVCLQTKVNAQNTDADSLLHLLSSAKEDTNKVNLLRSIGVAFANEDPAKAIEYWKQGVNLSRKLNYTVGLARNFINIGTGYSYLSKFDSCVIYADSGILYSKKTNNAERLALAYLNKGDGYRNLGDFKSALLYCDTAGIYAAQTANTDRQARIYDIISGIYAQQQQFGNAVIFLNKAIELYKKDNNNIMVGQAYDDFGDIYKLAGKLDSSLLFHKMAISIGESENDIKNLSVYYYGAADIYNDQGKYKDAEIYIRKSLEYASQHENNNHLASAYTLLGNIYIKQKKNHEAVNIGITAYQFAISEVQISWQQQSAALLAEAYNLTGDYKKAYDFLTISSKLADSLTKQAFNGEVAGLQSSFEIKEKDKTILLLNKENELREQQLKQKNIFIIGAVVFALLVFIGFWLLINRNKLKQRMKELELRGKIAADLHDEVGSTLSSIRMYSDIVKKQIQQSSTSAELLDKISSNSKEMIENMSDIVWMIKPGNDAFANIENRMLNFANELCTPAGINFDFTKEGSVEEIKMPMEQRRDVYLIFKEAINNAVKYSGCHFIHSKISSQDNLLQMFITDDGNGFDTTLANGGNGLSNMKKRAEAHRGTIAIQSSIGGGTEVIVSLPV